MSRIPRTPHAGDPGSGPAPSWPTPLDREALRLVRLLTTVQRHLIVRAGLPRWPQLATPWRPASHREAADARELASRAFGILEALPSDPGAYQLTPLGERVAGSALLNVLTIS